MAAGGSQTTAANSWKEAVDDLLDRDNVDASISLLESVVFSHHLKTLEHAPSSSSSSPPTSDPHLASLRSARGCHLEPPRNYETIAQKEPAKEDIKASAMNDDDDDWEAVADRGPPDIGITKSPSKALEGSQIPLETKCQTPKRRGRGSFMYKKDGLYSDEKHVTPDSRDSDAEEDSHQEYYGENGLSLKTTRKFGTNHVLVLYDFSPSMRTTDLERYFGKFGNSEVAIRWVNNTCALAVFQTPASAIEAQKSISFPFEVRLIEENDTLLNQVSSKDLEPPLPRPKTSARTAHRMIAQVMGLKPSPEFGSKELKKQEQVRKERIRARQIMRDDAWGSDDS